MNRLSNKSRLRNFLLAALLPLLASPELVNADWNKADFTAKSKVVINASSAAASATVVNAPIVIRLHGGNFTFTDAKPDGSDIRIIAGDDKTELKYHIEKYDAVNELAVIWVQLPKLDPKEKDQHLWIYSGNEKATPVADAKATWDANTIAAFQFAAKAPLQDSSASALAATGNITTQKAALLGESAIFAGTPLTIAANPATSITAANGLTYSAWIKPASIPQTATLFAQGDISIKIDGSKLSLAVGKATVAGGEIKATAWQHIAVSLAGGKANLYINGAEVANGDAPVVDTQGDIQIGNAYNGELDELELAKVARAADWIKLAASSQGADSQFLKVEAEDGEEGDEEGGASYITILLNSLTPDAKVVIGILAVMFAISTAVMISKGMLVGRTDKDNKRFMGRFQNASGAELLNLDQADKFVNSTLFKCYSAGIREIRKREKAGVELTLSGASMDAIKAAIDADLVRETQRINDKMVLLTIAISGGPFLGLLGTVVGVMITFAAIAAAGDVNVNAIAPGIAAALLATVAGLGVAIPALFGYNYLASRIKNITIEMQIFVDEFVTRVAELHGK